MKIVIILMILLIPVVSFPQKAVDVTGRISYRVLRTQYDEESAIKPDSIPESEYGKGTLIPGLQQSLNLALFARSRGLDITLLGDIRHDPWNELNQLERLQRLSLSARFGLNNELVLGDFFESGSEFFIQSREVRGGKLFLQFNNLWNNRSSLETKILGGRIERSQAIGGRIPNLYRQYNNSGQYRRYFASADIRLADSDWFSLGLSYLYARDDSLSINRSINEPLDNQNAGARASLFFWDKKIRLFGEGFTSRKDTLTGKSVDDYTYQAGVDFRYNMFKLIGSYYRLGYDYYTAGYPFLFNDRQGLKLNSAVLIGNVLTLFAEAEQYHNNLSERTNIPQTTTRLLDVGFSTTSRQYPDITLKFGLRDDNSPVLIDALGNETRTERLSLKYEGRLGYGFGANRLSLTAMYIDLDDQSVFSAGTPLGTEQIITSLNVYTRPAATFFLSGGLVYSRLLMSNNQQNDNLYIYESSRWDVIPRKLQLETTISYIYNDAANGGYQDLLSDYDQLAADISLEWFLTSAISIKAIGGTDLRHMRYKTAEALSIIADPDYGPRFFNGFESYDGLKYGAELNWIF